MQLAHNNSKPDQSQLQWHQSAQEERVIAMACGVVNGFMRLEGIANPHEAPWPCSQAIHTASPYSTRHTAAHQHILREALPMAHLPTVIHPPMASHRMVSLIAASSNHGSTGIAGRRSAAYSGRPPRVRAASTGHSDSLRTKPHLSVPCRAFFAHLRDRGITADALCRCRDEWL